MHVKTICGKCPFIFENPPPKNRVFLGGVPEIQISFEVKVRLTWKFFWWFFIIFLVEKNFFGVCRNFYRPLLTHKYQLFCHFWAIFGYFSAFWAHYLLFPFFIIVERFQTPYLRAEMLYFLKIKFSGPVEYSMPVYVPVIAYNNPHTNPQIKLFFHFSSCIMDMFWVYFGHTIIWIQSSITMKWCHGAKKVTKSPKKI